MTPQLSPELEGINLASKYAWRQHWRMKWMTAIISGPMAAYSIYYHEWIPFLGFNWFLWGMIIFISISTQFSLNKLFTIYVNHKRKGEENSPEVMREIGHHAWINWGTGLLFWYWIPVMIFASDLILLDIQ